MKKLLLVFTLLITTFVFGQQNEEPIQVPKIATKVPFGETVQTNGYAITFSEILEDSRCPTEVTCVWEGRIKVKVVVKKEGNKLAEEILIFGKTNPKEKKNHTFFTSSEIKLEGIKVTPYPKTEAQKKEDAYVLLVGVFTN